MITKLILAAAGAAAAVSIAAAPQALAGPADLTNTDVAQQKSQHINIEDPWEDLPGTAPFKNGLNTPTMQPTIYSGPDCQPVMGSWDDAGFHPDPNGHEVAYGSNPSNLKRHPYKTGLN